MAVKVMIKRHIKEGKAKDVFALLNKTRSDAMNQKDDAPMVQRSFGALRRGWWVGPVSRPVHIPFIQRALAGCQARKFFQIALLYIHRQAKRSLQPVCSRKGNQLGSTL